jgi:anaerobic C4-dicarboxylate transporter
MHIAQPVLPGHVVYTMFPIIADIALKKGIRTGDG